MENDCLEVDHQEIANWLLSWTGAHLNASPCREWRRAAEVPGQSVNVRGMGRSAFLPPRASCPEQKLLCAQTPLVGKQVYF